MKRVLLLILPISLFAKVHYAKVEPFETITLKSAVSAQVIEAKTSLEGKKIKKSTIIKLDDKLDRIKIKSSQNSIKLIKKYVKYKSKDTLSS